MEFVDPFKNPGFQRLGVLVEEQIEDRQLSVRVVADMAKMSPSQLSRALSGHDVGLSALLRAAAALEIEVDSIDSAIRFDMQDQLQARRWEALHRYVVLLDDAEWVSLGGNEWIRMIPWRREYVAWVDVDCGFWWIVLARPGSGAAKREMDSRDIEALQSWRKDLAAFAMGGEMP